MRAATAALATARAAQIRFTRRNAETKAWAIAVWMAELVCESRPSGTSRPASLMTLDWIWWRAAGARFKPARECCRLALKALTMTIPKMATASTPATRDTALLIPEAVPARALIDGIHDHGGQRCDADGHAQTREP